MQASLQSAAWQTLACTLTSTPCDMVVLKIRLAPSHQAKMANGTRDCRTELMQFAESAMA